MINFVIERKVTAIILKRTSFDFRLLVFKFDKNSYPFFRLPGGSVENNESFEEAVYREIKEEVGINESELVYFRKVGYLEYYKPLIHKKVKMQNFLFFYNGISNINNFEYVIKSDGKDSGIKLKYQWVSCKEIYKIDPELSQLMNPYNLPELFLKSEKFGLRKSELKLQKTEENWKRIYEFEEIQIREKLEERVKVYHIGSTAVNDFIAKPIIDILVEFEIEQDVEKIIDSLKEIGYVYYGEHGINGRLYFTKGTNDVKYFHLHAFKKSAKEIDNHLKVIDVLEKNNVFKNKYYNYKKKNYELSRTDYTKNKSSIIAEIINLSNQSI